MSDRDAGFREVSIDQIIPLPAIASRMGGIIQFNHPKRPHRTTIANDKIDVLLIDRIAQAEGISGERDKIGQPHFAGDVACRVGTLQQDLEERMLGCAQERPGDGERALVGVRAQEPGVDRSNEKGDEADDGDPDENRNECGKAVEISCEVGERLHWAGHRTPRNSASEMVGAFL